MRIDCLSLRDLPANQRWLPWSDLPFLDKYVLQFAEKRFDQQFTNAPGTCVSSDLRRPLDSCAIRGRVG